MAEHSIVGRVVKEKSIVGIIDKGTGMGELPKASGLNAFPNPAYSVNGTDLAAVGAAIAEKAGVDAPAWPEGFVSAVEGIEGKQDAFYSSAGAMYIKNIEVPSDITFTFISGLYANATELERYIAQGANVAYATAIFDGCTKLKEVVIGRCGSLNHYIFRNCTSLETAVLGGIGYPVAGAGIYGFLGCTQSTLTITVYVDAVTFAEISANVIGTAPWGATNATIIYRNSTTGEVITE